LLNDCRDGFKGLIGDSELVLRGIGVPKQFLVYGIPGINAAAVELIENDDGRLGALLISVEAQRLLDAYRLAQTVFNKICMICAVRFGIPLRQSGLQVTRTDSDMSKAEWVRLVPTGYPNAPADVHVNVSPEVAHFFASYTEGIRSNSPFYSLLCFFTLTEFLTSKLQGRFRRYAAKLGTAYIDLKGQLSKEDVRFIGSFLGDITYDELLKQTRDTRDAIAHFITNVEAVVPRPFNVEAEDEVACYRDALKVAAQDLLGKVEANVAAFKARGATDKELKTVIEGTWIADPDAG
jgi:hypothetical protein